MKGKHADILFEMIEGDLANLNQHKYEVFKENVQRVFTNRMSMVQSKNSMVGRPTDFERKTSGAGGSNDEESRNTTIRRSDLSTIDEDVNRNHTTMFNSSDVTQSDSVSEFAESEMTIRATHESSDKDGSKSSSRGQVDRDSDL